MTKPVQSAHTIKSLITKLRLLNDKADQLRKDLGDAEAAVLNNRNELSQTIRQIQETRSEIGTLQQSQVVVSEHALLRYAERVLGINLDEIRQKILTDDLRHLIDKMAGTGNGKFTHPDGYRLIVKNRVVATIED